MPGIDPDTGDAIAVPRYVASGSRSVRNRGASGRCTTGELVRLSGVGRVYRFDVSTGDLTETYEKPRGGNEDQGFGWSVAQVGSNLIVGAPFASSFSGNAFLIDGATGAERRIWQDPTFSEEVRMDGRGRRRSSRGRRTEDDIGNPGNRGGLTCSMRVGSVPPGDGSARRRPTTASSGSRSPHAGPRSSTGAPGEDVAGESTERAYLFDWVVAPNGLPDDAAGLRQSRRTAPPPSRSVARPTARRWC